MPLPLSQLPPPEFGMQFAAMPAFPNGSFSAGLYTLIFRLRHKISRQILKQHSLILMPTRFTQTTEIRTSLYYTQGGPVTDTPRDGGVGMTYFSIQGHTGFWGLRTTPQANPVAERLGLPATLESLGTVAQSLLQVVQGGGSVPLMTSLI